VEKKLFGFLNQQNKSGAFAKSPQKAPGPAEATFVVSFV